MERKGWRVGEAGMKGDGEVGRVGFGEAAVEVGFEGCLEDFGIFGGLAEVR